jgi:hydroxymethylbilane synthase
MLIMRAVVVSLDGSEVVEAEEKMAVKTKEDAEEFGVVVARTLVQRGADKILEAIALNRKAIAEQGDA